MRKPVLLTGSALALLLGAPAFTATASAACDPAATVENGVALGDSLFSAGTTSCYVVPAGVESLRTTLIGGRGGNSNSMGYLASGGRGALVQARLDVTPGQQLAVVVAGNGLDVQSFGSTSGGGASSVDDVLIAGGGGGAGAVRNPSSGSHGGEGGSAGASAGAGAAGTAYNGTVSSAGGSPGLYNAVGAGGFFPGGFGSGGSGSGGGGGFGGFGPEGFGGGGGAGLYGGGGGSGGTFTPGAGGGGGGAGSSFIDPSVDGGSIATDGSGTPMVLITAGGVGGVDAVPHAGLDFTATQPQGTLSAPMTVTLTSTGTAPLRIGALTVGGANPDDFIVSGDTCRATLKVGVTCKVFVRFTPQATGPRAATLDIDGNLDTASVPLTGTGGALPTGATGLTGATGVTGSVGATGATGVQGIQGIVGATGATGQAGSAGLDGVTGAVGATGAAGTEGKNGTAGTTGAVGATGAAGVMGPTGATGAAGVDGKDATASCLIQTSKTKDDAAGSATVLCTISTVAARRSGTAAAALTRKGRVLATGTEKPGRALKLKVRGGGTLEAGHYTLRRTYRQAGRTVVERRPVVLR